jgi:hypothetical protein
MELYKFLDLKDGNHGYKAKLGAINIDPKADLYLPVDDLDSCSPGAFYAAEFSHLGSFLSRNRRSLVKVTKVPEYDVVRDPDHRPPKWRSYAFHYSNVITNVDQLPSDWKDHPWVYIWAIINGFLDICDEFGKDNNETLSRITHLDLDNNNLSALPESIGSLIRLKRLDLRWNNLSALPESIGSLRNLKRLSLSGNKLTALPESIGSLRNMEYLYLRNNNLTALPDSLVSLRNLERLDLSDNPIAHGFDQSYRDMLPAVCHVYK